MRLAGGAALFVAAQLPIQLRVCLQRKLPRQQRSSHTEALAFLPGEPPDVAGGAAVRLCIARCIGGCIAGRLRARGPVAVARVPRNPKPPAPAARVVSCFDFAGRPTEKVRRVSPWGWVTPRPNPHHRSLPSSDDFEGRLVPTLRPCRPAPSGIGIRGPFADLRRGGPERDQPRIAPARTGIRQDGIRAVPTPTPVPHFQPAGVSGGSHVWAMVGGALVLGPHTARRPASCGATREPALTPLPNPVQ